MTAPRSPLFTSVRYARRRRWGRTLRYAAIGLLALLVLILGIGLGLWRYASSQIERVEAPSLTPPEHVDVVPGTLNVLVVGSDSRAGLTPEQLQALGTDDHGGRLTDTIMLVQISPAREQTVILSFPRDLKVNIPGHAREAKINSAHGRGGEEGGPDLLVQTVQDLTGIGVDHYVEVDLAGFLRLTDAIGGVEVCLDEAMVDRFAGVNLPAGCQVLDGVQATGFVRARRVADGFGQDDFGRIARQQYFVKQAMDRVASAQTFLNPLRLKRLIDVVAASVRTDKALSPTEMFRLASALRDLDSETVETRVVPSYWDGQFMVAFPEQAEALFQALRDGTALPNIGLTLPTELAAGDVRVQVLNGAGIDGLASEVQAFLEARGFVVVEVGNAAAFDHETTLVAYAGDDEAKAALVAEFLPGAQLEETDTTPATVDVIVTVGRDWTRP